MRFNIKLGGIRAGPDFAVKFGSTNQTFRAEFTAFQVVTGANPEYEGPTTVTPSGSAQTLPTAHKYLTDNIIVQEIKRWDVGNTSGGNTVYIGEE